MISEIILIFISLFILVLQIFFLLRQYKNASYSQTLERNLRTEINGEARLTRIELSEILARQNQHSLLQTNEARQEQATALHQMRETIAHQLLQILESNTQCLQEIRTTFEQRLKEIETQNTSRLEEIRRTVDEKLHATLEQRLGASFRSVSERLEQVHRGLGEMHTLAQGVGDLKKVLTNVKSRGTWGEVQLDILLSQILTVEQYAKNVETVSGTGARVEFAIRLPGRAKDDTVVWLPIDAKFPKEQYERLIDAQERADTNGIALFSAELERAIRREAQTIAEKYLAPPATTDFAILFLPTESLYAEIIRRVGLLDLLQQEYRVTLAGPTTLAALLNSLQMGFRTLALEQRSSEVWSILSAVKTEFGKFGTVLAKTRDTLEKAARHIDSAQTRTRVMVRKLGSVEVLSENQAQDLLGLETEMDITE